MYLFKNIVIVSLLSVSIVSCSKKIESKNAGLSGLVSEENATKKKPNIILLIGDDIGREIPTYNGGQSYNTPNMDFMAANGMQFPNFFAHPDGPPSRLALVTGRYNNRNWEEFGQLPASEKTFANVLENAGYSTCYIGKWQFDGGDSNIVNHGFQKYLVFMPFEPINNNGHDQFYHRYKNPYLYSNGAHLTDEEVEGKYSEDMYFDYASAFIDSNKSNSFLMVYAFNLAQKPWVPTPDNPEFANWNPDRDELREDKKYFPEMVGYMDKILGKIISKVQSAGLNNKTIFLFTSDNASNKNISSVYKGQTVKGTKGQTTFYGTNVPLLAYAPGLITSAGSIDTALVDMTDFFPTIANMANVGTAAYKPLDGKTFYDNITGAPTTERKYVYCFWPQYFRPEPAVSYVFDYNYKLYDSTWGSPFFNIGIDKDQLYPIPEEELTSDEIKTRNKFSRILANPTGSN